MQDVFVFPCELGDKERGKYMHKVGTEMVGVKKKKNSNNESAIVTNYSNKFTQRRTRVYINGKQNLTNGKSKTAYRSLHLKTIGFSHQCMTDYRQAKCGQGCQRQ